MQDKKWMECFRITKGLFGVIAIINFLLCFCGCDLWYKDFQWYLNHWSEPVQIDSFVVKAIPEIQQNSNNDSTISSNTTVTATVSIINPEGYELNGDIGSASEALKSVRISGPSGWENFELVSIASISATEMQVEIKPLAQVPTTETLALEHTNFTITISPTRTENGMPAKEAKVLSLRYNTPPRMPLEVTYDVNQQKLTWLGNSSWQLVQGAHDSALDNLIFWAWPADITKPTHPDYVEKFRLYEDGVLVKEYTLNECLMSNVDELKAFVPQDIITAGYNVYYAPGSSGKKITICAVDSEGICSEMATSGVAPYKLTLKTNDGFFQSTGITSLELFKANGSIVNGGDLEIPIFAGHYLSGWTYEGDLISFPLTIDKDMELVAQWTVNPPASEVTPPLVTYTISYNGNGVDNLSVPATQTVIEGDAVSLAAKTGQSSRTSPVFIGWNTEKDGSGTSYAAGASYTAQKDIVLYAQWRYEEPQVNSAGKYEITNAGNLMWFVNHVNNGNSSANAVLTSDINMNALAWTAMGQENKAYTGTFDGAGYTISNLNHNTGLDEGARGSFVYYLGAGGRIENVNFDNAEVFAQGHANTNASAVIVLQNSGTISKCIVSNSRVQLGNYAYLAGIAGVNNSGGVIENCAVINTNLTRRFSGLSHAIGGIVQKNDGTVENCFTYGCSYNSSSQSNGGINVEGSATPTNCYYYTTSSVTTGGGTAKSVTEFASSQMATDLGSAWTYVEGDKYPVLVQP